jgi:hypothetical protein
MTLDTIGSITPTFGINFRNQWGRNFGYKGNDYGFTPQGHNVLCANNNFIYTSTGDSVQKRDIANGLTVASVAIPGGGVSIQSEQGLTGLLPKNGGIALDDCGNVYIGSQTGVYKLDANLNFLNSASTQGAVYALAVNNNGEVAASGAGFVASFNMSACSPYLSPPFNVTPSPANVTCNGLCNGNAAVTATNGVQPYTYLWSNGDTSASVTGLCMGSYRVTVTDGSGSSASTTVNIGLTPFALTDSIINTPCGSNTGAIGILSLTGVFPYTISWNNGASSSSIFGLTPGIYSVVITDAEGCVLVDSFSVLGTGNSPITINANNQVICDYDSAQICAPAGYAIYQWSNGERTQCITTNAANSYSTTVIDNVNCIAVSNLLTISVLTGPTVTASLSGNILTANVIGQAISYQWYRNDTLIPGANANTLTASLAGNYKVSATGTNGCAGVSPSVYFTPCTAYFVLFPDLNTPHNWFAVNQATGTQPMTYTWSWGDGTTSTGAFPSHTYASAGNYDICLSISDATGCSNTFCDSSVYLYKTDNMVTVNVVSETPNGIQESSIPSGIYLFPNPGSNELNIRFRGLQAERVRLFSVNGQLISDISYPADNRIDVNNLPKGVYVVEVKIWDTTTRLKWTK